jgi:protein disulfide-isomerase
MEILMKFIALLALCMSISAAQGFAVSAEVQQQAVKQDQEINWVTDIEKAKILAARNGVPIFLYFSGSDWCPHCKNLDRNVLAKAQFQNALDGKIIFMHVDFPKHVQLDPKTKDQNRRLKNSFSISGYPTVLVVDADLKVIGKPSKKGGPDEFAREVLKVIKK